MSINIPSDIWQDLYKYHGDAADKVITQAKKRLAKYTEQWDLQNVAFMACEANLLFLCESQEFGSCVLKVGLHGEDYTEINCLREYNGNGYCRLYKYDYEDSVLLLQRIYPGNRMWDITDHNERARLFAQVLNGLQFHETTNITEQYPTYLTCMESIRKTLIDMSGHDDLICYLDKAIKTYSELKQRHPVTCLLHGDMHQENLLLNETGGYTIVDPKGMSDMPVMETARFIMNEVNYHEVSEPFNENNIKQIVEIISADTDFAKQDIFKAMFVDAALGQAWSMEEHYPTQTAFNEAKQEALDICAFVYGLL